MGVSVSSPEVIKNQVITTTSEVLNKTIQTCQASSNNIQQITIQGIRTKDCNVKIGDFTQTIDSSINVTCVKDAVQKDQFKNDLKNEINKKITDITDGLTFKLDVDRSKLNENLLTSITNKVTNDVNFETIIDKSNEQLVNIKDLDFTCSPLANEITISNINQVIVTKIIADQLNKTDFTTEFNNVSAQVNKVEITKINTGFDVNEVIKDAGKTVSGVASKVSSALSLPITIIFGVIGVIIVLIVLSLLYYFLSKRTNGGETVVDTGVNKASFSQLAMTRF
jgi:hypothetical protein